MSPKAATKVIQKFVQKDQLALLTGSTRSTTQKNHSIFGHALKVFVLPLHLILRNHAELDRMLRHNAIEAWETMQKTGGWKRCSPRW